MQSSTKIYLKLLAGIALLVAGSMFLVMHSCGSSKQVPKDGSLTVHIATVNNNVCKKLQDHVVVYAVFVDTRFTQPWTEYDIMSTLDSVRYAMQWVEKQAQRNGASLKITVAYNQSGKTIPVAQEFGKKTLSGTLFPRPLVTDIAAVTKWADKAAASTAKDLQIPESTLIKTKNTLSDRERLIAALRDKYRTDNVALMYFINNYYKRELSCAIYTGSANEIEYAIVSFKDPAVIAHEFLHLFGALDFGENPLIIKKKKTKVDDFRKEYINKEFPNEIMTFAYRKIDSLDVGPLTSYLIGWSKVLEKKHQDFLFDGKFTTAKY